jgi:hypothetical protein
MTANTTTTPRTAQVHIRSQHSNGSSAHRFGGPDTYVAVTVAPAGVAVPYVLRRDVLARRGIEIRYYGEGYSRHSGPRSMLGRAIAAANQFARSINAQEVAA